MKKILIPFLFALMGSTLLLSCKSADFSGENMKVVRDCTGTYIRFNEKDYQVCNLDKLSGFADGQVVKAKFRKVEKCTDKSQPEMVCMMYHENEGWIQVQEIK